jgi:hypothetical protein
MATARRRVHAVPLATVLAGALGALALTLPPRGAHAQRESCRYYSRGRWYECRVEERRTERQSQRFRRDLVPRRQLSLQVGALRYDQNGRETVPMAALRADWRLAPALRSELGLAYGFGDVPRLAGTGGTGPIGAHLLAPTLGLIAELPTPYLRPYVGAAAGLFGRFDESGGERFVRPTFAVPVGLRAQLGSRLALRAETRFRFDQHPSGATAPNTEFTAGLAIGY